ncbi:ABC transporter ATP-binding protein [Paenibacillus amylolyticus]|nr:ABC transporter ATP-binding protein [Paenibacillus amylolyticus]WFR61358.1 ABC transporter ATP-binding protein [Paenibacillus amylolyticus]
MVVLYVLQTLIHRYRIRRANQVGQLIVSELRTSLFQKIMHMPFKSLDKKSTGHIFSRVIGDVNTLEDLLTNGFINSIIDCIQLVGIVTILLVWNFKLGMAIILTVPLMFLVSFLLRRKIRKEFQDLRTKQVQINSHLNEAIQGIKITKAYGQEKNNIQYFNMLNRQHIKIWDKASALNQSFNPIIELACAMGTVILFAYGSYLIQINAITVGTIIGFTSYISNFWEPVNRLGQIYSQLLVCMASSERIFEFMDEKRIGIVRPT